MRLYATSRTELDLDPGAVVRDGKMGGDFSLSRVDGAGKVAAPFSREGTRLKMTLEGERGTSWRCPGARAPPRPAGWTTISPAGTSSPRPTAAPWGPPAAASP